MNITGSKRFEVLQRDGFKCRYCGAQPFHTTLHMDHVMPQSLGGTDERSNLAAACQRCNLGKHAAAPSPELVAAVIADDVRYEAQQRRAGSALCHVCGFAVITELEDDPSEDSRHESCDLAFTDAYRVGTNDGYARGASDWIGTMENRAQYTDPLARHIDRFAGVAAYEHWDMQCSRWEPAAAERWAA